MAPRGRARLNLRLGPGTVSVWQQAAEDMGFVASRGPDRGRGAVSLLLEAMTEDDFDWSRLEGLFRAGLTEVAPPGEMTRPTEVQEGGPSPTA